ncbi:protein fam210a-like protein [Plakobranchus ocellatus]|uniref:Protein fam210a-like protein n=1 Tax=Plakobranchus ocellatus TaxID=259542 RepID=A0AAV4B9P3_9GAST|nr:protein fam210a-like protein [Plakobranchus ocellatus]
MSSSSLHFSVVRFTGPAMRRLKCQHFTGVKRCFSHRTSHGYSSGQPGIFQWAPWQVSNRIWGSGTRFPSHLNGDVLSHCLLNKMHYSSGPIFSGVESHKRLQGLLGDDLYAKDFLSVSPVFIAGFPVNPSMRFMSSQQRPRERKVFNQREGRNLGKRLKNTRDSSEHSGGRSTDKKTSGDHVEVPEKTEETEEKLTLYQRFKKTYKEHGKVLVAVHVATSLVWFSTFYTAASLGFDIVPLLESWNMSERVISPFRSGGLGNVALAYLFYKLATPARYTVTIAGTRFAISYLQKEGKMKVVPKEDSLRSLYKEGKEKIKGRSKRRISSIRRRARRARGGSDHSSHKM